MGSMQSKRKVPTGLTNVAAVYGNQGLQIKGVPSKYQSIHQTAGAITHDLQNNF